MASSGGGLPLKIQQSDLTGDCARLNRRFAVDEGRISALETTTTSLTAAQAGAVPAGSLYDTHANRTTKYAPASYLKSLFVETDRGNIVYQSQYVSDVPKWVYVGGVVSKIQSAVAALQATLGTTDAGLLLWVIDFGHLLEWSGIAWQWGPGDGGSGMMVLFEVDPTGPGWRLYDGSTVSYLKQDGTTGSVTLPNLTATPAYPKAGTPNSGPNAPVAPTVTGGAISNAATGVSATTGATLTTQIATVAGVSAVPTWGHTHQVFVSDPTHTHSVSGITIGSNGEPESLVRRPWFRQ